MAEKMLVIDDEELVLESCRKVFTAEGFEVVTTNRPAEGLELISGSRFDVVLCDWKMPDFDGMDVVEEIDRRSPESAVVMISGFPSVGRATEAMKRGAMDYVSKPFTPEEISGTVKRAIRQKVVQEKKAMGRMEGIMKSIQFPVPAIDDRAPQTIAETIAKTVNVKKATSPWTSVAVLAVLAGAYIGFGGLLMTVVTFDMGTFFGVGFSKLVGGAVFSVGLMLVVIAGAELFTGNNLMVTSTVTRDITVGVMLERWVLVWVANFGGAVIVALLFYLSGLWKTGNGALGAAAVKIAYGKASLPFVEALTRGIGCNWLVCLAVWMALASRQTVGKIFAIFFPIMAFVAIGFEHSVANMYFLPTGLFLAAWGHVPLPSGADAGLFHWGGFLYRNLLPVTVGNIIGGGLFVGMSYWGAYLKPRKA